METQPTPESASPSPPWGSPENVQTGQTTPIATSRVEELVGGPVAGGPSTGGPEMGGPAWGGPGHGGPGQGGPGQGGASLGKIVLGVFLGLTVWGVAILVAGVVLMLGLSVAAFGMFDKISDEIESPSSSTSDTVFPEACQEALEAGDPADFEACLNDTATRP